MPQDTALLRLRIAKLRAAILTVQLAKGDGHVPPEGVRSAARRGLEARKKWGRGGLSNTEASDQGIGSGVQRAANLANGDAVSTETVRRMHAFFSRHAKNYRPDAKEPDGGPTAGTIAWWLWGGNAGKAWAESITNRLEKMNPSPSDVHVPAPLGRTEIDKAEDPRKTPAPAEDRIRGSEKNPEGSAADRSGGISLDDAALAALKRKVEEHNEKHGQDPAKKASLAALKAVWRRGAGAYSTSHRPGVSRSAWAMARVNAHLTLLRRGSPARSAYVQDNDLLPSAHPMHSGKTVSKGISDLLSNIRERLDLAKANRWPAGAPQSKGGQFAPAKGSAGGGFKAPQLGLSGPLSGSSGAGGQGSFWSAPAAAKAPPPGAKAHPAGTDDKGKPVTINYPSKPSAPETWNDPDKVATFVPGGETPPALNGVAFRPWKPPAEDAGWATVAGQNARIEEDPFEPAPGKGIGTGVVIVEGDGRVWLTKPTNEFGGYEHTFPKGGMEPGLPMQANAIKEAYEETGLKVEITGVLGDFERTTSKARYYVARRVSGTPSAMGWETQAMRLAPVARMKSLLNMGVDKSITDAIQAEIEVGGSLAKARGLLARARVLLAKAKAPGGGNSGAWAKQPRWPSGTPVGGQFKAYDSDGIPTPPPKIGSAGNMGPQKAAQALYALAKSGDLAGLKDYAAKNAGKLAAWNQGSGKGLNTQAKWSAMNAYYAGALADTLQAAPKAEAAAAKIRGPEKLSSMTKIGAKPGGSNPGGIYQDGKGDAWLVKGNAKVVQGAVTEAQSNDRAKNEILASKLMAAVGAGTVEMKLVDLEDAFGLGGGLGVAGKMLDGFQALNTKNAAHLAATQADFAVHAWLGNYDVLGMGADNTVIKDGKAINIDPGGAILFRAQGLPKDKFGDKADEWDSMRTTTAEQKAVYGKMTASQLTESAKKLQQINDDTIKKLVDAHGPGDAAAKAQLAQTLIARRDDILTRAGLKGPAAPKNDDDALMALFSVAMSPAASTPAPGPSIDPQALKSSLQAVADDAKSKIDALNAKKYKENKTVIEFEGDGPGKSPFKSIGGINAAKKKKAIAAHSATIQAVNDIMGKMNAPGGAEQMAALISQTLADAKKNVASGTSIFSTVKQSFEYSILDKLGFKAKYGAVLSNDVSKLLYAMAEGTPPPVAAPAAKPAAKPAAQNFGMFASLKADIDDAVKTGDKSALDGVKAYLTAPQNKNEPGSAEMLAYLQSQTSGTPARAPAPAAAAPAPAAAAPATAAVPPTFNTGLKSDGYYTSLALTVQSFAGSGDLDAMKQWKAKHEQKTKATWAGNTANSKKLVGYYDAIVADLEGKAKTQQAAVIQAAQDALAKPAQAAQAQAVAQAKAAVSLPDFDATKLPAGNSNAASHNAKIDKIKDLAAAGDVMGLISLNYGTNTYGKKQAQIANDTLAALGSDLKVAAGQKANTHPSLTGGIPAAQAAAALATAGAPALAPHPATKPKQKPVFKAENLKAPPNFNVLGSGGKPLSSQPHINEANNKAVNHIFATAQTGDLQALQNLTFRVIDKATGAPTGQFQSYGGHPSVHVSSYWKDLVGEVDLQLNPPRMPKIGRTVTGATLQEISAKLKPVPSGKSIAAVAKSQRIGNYIVLGKADPVMDLPAADDSVIAGASWVSAAQKHYAASPQTAKDTFGTYVTTSGAKALNTALRTGTDAKYGGKSVEQHTKDFEALLVDVPPGSTFVRNMGTKGYGQTPNTKELQELQQFLLTAEKGTVLQEPGYTSSSWTGGNQILGNNDIQWNFTAGPGVRVFPAWLGANVGEGEGLFPPNQRYLIRGAKKVGKTVVVDAVLLPTLPN